MLYTFLHTIFHKCINICNQPTTFKFSPLPESLIFLLLFLILLILDVDTQISNWSCTHYHLALFLSRQKHQKKPTKPEIYSFYFFHSLITIHFFLEISKNCYCFKHCFLENNFEIGASISLSDPYRTINNAIQSAIIFCYNVWLTRYSSHQLLAINVS